MRRFYPLFIAAGLVIAGLALLSAPAALIGAGAALAGGWYLFEEVDE